MGSDARVFINYSGPDLEQVKRLAKILERQGIELFLDRENIPADQPEVLAKLAGEIRDADVFLACVGPAGITESTWHSWEQSIAARLNAKTDGLRTIPVFLPGAEIDETDPRILAMGVDSRIHFKDTIATDKQNLFALIKAITGQEPEKLVEMENDPPGGLRNPYRGLKYFDVADTQWFYGRERLTDRLIERVQTVIDQRGGIRLLVLVGASGSGKSSLARAGLLAALRAEAIAGSQNWRYAILRPGANPVQALIDIIPDALNLGNQDKSFFAKELRADAPPATVLHDAVRGGEKLVLLVDQFEEVFTLCADEKTQRVFIENLLYAANANQQTTDGSVIAVLTLRNDFTHLLAGFPVQGMRPAPDIPAMIDSCQITIAPMSADELRRAIRLPALNTGCDFGLFLVDKIRQDAQKHEGALPLLQVALQKLWNTCRANGDGAFTVEAYEKIGELAGALSQEADKTYDELSEEEQKIARHVFLQLVVRQPDARVQDARRSVMLSDLCRAKDRERVGTVVQKLASGGLLVTDRAAGQDGDSRIEIMHEALFQYWNRLRGWIEEERESLKEHQRIRQGAEDW
ncbi:MAG: toll/interleukin-1 receptor domain-containing protein [Azoarcus sp.]|jgi:hypothetical protein|nr:toll/interleukin-1 receptor domain-containing protein [Azoarcus sp.]